MSLGQVSGYADDLKFHLAGGRGRNDGFADTLPQ